MWHDVRRTEERWMDDSRQCSTYVLLVLCIIIRDFSVHRLHHHEKSPSKIVKNPPCVDVGGGVCGGKSRLKIWIFASVSCQNRKKYYRRMSTGTRRMFQQQQWWIFFFFAVSIRDDAFTTAIYSMAPCTTITFWELVNSFLYPIHILMQWFLFFLSTHTLIQSIYGWSDAKM